MRNVGNVPIQFFRASKTMLLRRHIGVCLPDGRVFLYRRVASYTRATLECWPSPDTYHKGAGAPCLSPSPSCDPTPEDSSASSGSSQ